jgi:hypothetical protein
LALTSGEIVDLSSSQVWDLEWMDRPCCCFCQKHFVRSPFHPQQTACSAKLCQQRRRSQNRKRLLAADPDYRDTCLESARKWRSNHPNYWRQYRADKPDSVEQNRVQQRQRDLPRRLAKLANNNLALDLKASVSSVWLLGPAVVDLANNNLASAQLFLLQRATHKSPTSQASCKQQPSGMAAAVA